MSVPSFLPVFDASLETIEDGALQPACSFCRKAFKRGPECLTHYRAILRQPEGYFECPFGFTTRTFSFLGERFAITGVVAHPRFGSAREQRRAKDHPETRVSREMIESFIAVLKQIEISRADAIQSAATVLPQAFHELRKLNGAILQHAEKELKSASSPALLTIKSAAELMRNNFDILEALSNIEGMRALPLDADINLYDLVYKTKKVLEERASAKGMQILLTGVRAMIPGSQKSFPIVPAVLIENAIKYGSAGSPVAVSVKAANNSATLAVENESKHPIDAVRCFERGTRYAGSAVEGGGFGLFLAKEIVRAHGGEISCHPSAGRVQFTVELPLQRVVPHDW